MIVIYNPFAGDKLADKYVAEYIVPALEKSGRAAELYKTEYEGHAEEIAAKLAQRGTALEICLIGGM